MEYMPGMEIIDSDIGDRVIAAMNNYDPNAYTAADVLRALSRDSLYPEDFAAGSGSLPTIIYIHGGGWMYGSADISDRYLGYLASRGYAVMAMNYRLLQQGNLQDMISDIFAAMSWLGKHGPVRGFDLSRVLVCGDSAGGHLSILTTCITRSEELGKIYSVPALSYEISAVSVSSPVAETGKLYIAASEDTELGQGTAKAYVDMMLGEKGKDAAWNGHMAASEVVPGPGLPPVHIIGSESDALTAHTGYLKEVLDKNGIPYELFYRSKEEGIHLLHVFNISHWEWHESIEANESMLAFFGRVTAN